jgi:hypothetical protein
MDNKSHNVSRVKFYGTRGHTSTKSKFHKKRTGTMIKINRTHLYIDCGINKKLKHNSAIILTKSPSILVHSINCSIYTTKQIAQDIGIKNVHEIFTCGQKINILGIDVLPIRTAYGFDRSGIGLLIDNIFISHKAKKVPNIDYWLSGIKYYIGDGSSFKSIISQIKSLKKHNIKCQCWFTNCGSDVILNHKNYSKLIDRDGKICIDKLIEYW